MNTSSRILSTPLRARVVLKYSGRLCLVVGVLSLLPLAVALRTAELELSLRHAIAVVVLGGGGWLASRLRAPSPVQANEAMAVAALVFVLTPLPLALPLMGSGMSFVDALFEAVSGVTTTGLSVLPSVADKPLVFHFQRAYMQWFGGLGIIVLLLAVTPRPGKLERGLALAERIEDDLVGGTAAHARRAVITYGALTAIAMAVIWLAGAGGQDAVLYGLSAVSTGGFAPHDDSLLALGGVGAQVAVTAACLAGAVSLVTHRAVLREGPRRALRDVQLRALLPIAALASVACGLSLHFVDGLSLGRAAVNGPLMALSAQTTSGFSCLQPTEMGNGTKLLLMVSMFTGASLGSSAGGIKLLRLLILLRVLHAAWVRLQLPRHAVHEPRLGDHVIACDEMQAAGLVVGLFAAVVLVSWVAFVMYGAPPLDALFEVVSATGTVGLSSGLSSSGLPAVLKLVLCVDMLMGRLEVVPLLVLLRLPHLSRPWHHREHAKGSES